jgi:hypothetical protein
MTTYCESFIDIGHERVSCMGDLGHAGHHFDHVFGTWPPCPKCGGLEDHGQRCPLQHRTGTALAWADIEWDEDGVVSVRPGGTAIRIGTR